MADAKFSALVDAGFPLITDEIAIARAGASRKLLLAQLINTQIFDVRKHGATGANSAAADQPAFEEAYAEAILVNGTVVIPPPDIGKTYRLDGGLDLVHPSNASFRVNTIASLPDGGIIYEGSGTTGVFRTRGQKGGIWSGIRGKIGTSGSTADEIAWFDVDADATHASSTQVLYMDCRINMDGTGTDNVCWRFGHASVGRDISGHTLIGCAGGGKTDLGPEGHIFLVLEGQNTLNIAAYNCWWTKMAKGITNIPTAGDADPSGLGGGSLFADNCGGAYNALEYDISRKYGWAINRGRYENGTQFLRVDNSGDLEYAQDVQVNGARIAGFTADTQFEVNGSVELDLNRVTVRADGERAGAGAYGADLITLAAAGNRGSLTINGGSYEVDTDPISVVISGEWKQKVDRPRILNSAGEQIGWLRDRGVFSRDEELTKGQGLGGENFPRQSVSSQTAPTSQRHVGGLIFLRAGDVVTNLCFQRQAAGATYTLARGGLYRAVDSVLVASTGDVSAALATANAPKLDELPLSAAYTVPTDGWYRVQLFQQATTTAALYRQGSLATLGALGTGYAPFAYQAGQTDLPATAAFTADTVGYWVGWS